MKNHNNTYRTVIYFERVTTWISRVLALIGGAYCGLVIVALVVDITSRYLFNHPFNGVSSAIVVTTPILFALGVAYAQVTNSHIRVSILSDKFKSMPRYIIEAGALTISVLLLALLAWVLIGNAIDSLNIREFEPGIVRVVIYPTKFILACCIALLSLRYFVVLIQHIISGPKTKKS